MDNDSLHIELDIEEINLEMVKEIINDNLQEFLHYCERLLNSNLANMTVVDDSLEIEEFYFDETDLTGHIAIGFLDDYYAGCKDQNSNTWHDSEETLEFYVDPKAKKIIFDIQLPRRWDVDEAMEDY